MTPCDQVCVTMLMPGIVIVRSTIFPWVCLALLMASAIMCLIEGGRVIPPRIPGRLLHFPPRAWPDKRVQHNKGRPLSLCYSLTSRIEQQRASERSPSPVGTQPHESDSPSPIVQTADDEEAADSHVPISSENICRK